MALLRTSLAALLLFTSSPLFASAQNLAKVVNFDLLPDCAQGCSALLTAEAGCVPQVGGLGAPATDQQTYQQCFCASNFVSGIRNNPQPICAAECSSQDDLGEIQGWFIGACDRQEGWPEQQAQQNPTATSTGAAAPGTTSDVAASDNDDRGNQGEPGWFASHWKWVLMLIIIALAMILGTVGGLWWKRRHQRKVDERNANVGAHDAISSEEKGKRVLPPPPPVPKSKASSLREKSGMSAAESPTMAGAMNGRSIPPPPPPIPRPSSGSLLGKSRSRSNTASSNAIVWGPHQNMAASGGFDSNANPNDRTSSIYGDNTPGMAVPYPPGDLPDRVYSPLVNRSTSSLHSGLGPGQPSGSNGTGAAAAAAAAAMGASIPRPPSKSNLSAGGPPLRSSSGSASQLHQQLQQRGPSPISLPERAVDGRSPAPSGGGRRKSTDGGAGAAAEAAAAGLGKRSSGKRLSKRGSRNAS